MNNVFVSSIIIGTVLVIGAGNTAAGGRIDWQSLTAEECVKRRGGKRGTHVFSK